MGYIALVKVAVRELFTRAMYLIVRENFRQGIPGKYTVRGQMYAGTGAQQADITAAPGAGRLMGVNTSNPNRLDWVGGATPLGSIIIWSGSQASIPGGWQLCDGTNGTPDLRDRFVVGAGGAYGLGNVGGSGVNLQHTHTPDAAATSSNAFSHTHTQGATGTGSHGHTANLTTGAASTSTTATATGINKTPNTHTHAITGTFSNNAHTHTNPTTGAAGPAHSHTTNPTDAKLNTTNLPPYYALCFIQRVS